MRFLTNHDLHIHSIFSPCAKDPLQTPENILRYATRNGLHQICLTDHFWDETVPGAMGMYRRQTCEKLLQALPLPQTPGVEFLFGCETELDKDLTLGLSREKMDLFDFIIIPTTHFHFRNFTVPEEVVTPEEKAKIWINRLDAVLNMDLPFTRVGIAHPVCSLIAKEDRSVYLRTLQSLPEAELVRVFSRAAEKGVGIELNGSDFNFPEEETEIILRPFRIAKACGCRFYFGSDAHTAKELEDLLPYADRAVDLLELEERHRFIPAR